MNKLVKVNSFSATNHELIINDDYVCFQNRSINRQHITGIKFSININQVYRFSIGRVYHIGLKTPADQLNIVFRSFLGIKNKYFQSLFDQIIESIWDQTFEKIWHLYVNALYSGEILSVGNCKISKCGILINQNHVLTKQQVLISWENLYYEKKYDRLVINHIDNSQIFTNLYFKNTWNIDIIIALLDWITKENGLANLP